MKIFGSAILIVESLLIATVFTRRFINRSGQATGVAGFLAWIVLFFVTLFGSFHILGYINLATDLPVVGPIHAAVIAGIALLAGALSLPWRAQKGMFAEPSGNGLELGSRLDRIAAVATLGTFIVIGIMLVRGFPRGYESTAYHLPIALHTFQSQSLKIWDTVAIHAYPANASVYFAFLLGSIPERLVTAGNLVFLVPLFVAIYGLGRATGADPSASRWAALGILTVPIVAFGASEAAADVAGLTFLAIAIYFAISTSGSRLLYSALSGLAAGLAFGFKSFHLISIGFLFVMIVLQERWSAPGQTRLGSLWSTVRPATVFGFSAMAIASFWLVRNYIELGNPLYPVHYGFFDVLGWTKAPDADFAEVSDTQFEWVRSTAEWALYPWLEWQYAGQNFKASSGLGAFFAATVPVACLIGFTEVIKQENKHWPAIASLLSGGAFVLFIWAFLGDRQPRYAIGALPFLVPLVASMINLTEGRKRRILEIIIATCILAMLFVVFSHKLVEFGRRFVYAGQNSRHAFYDYPEMVDRLPAGSTVVNFARRTLNYGLFGSRHQNRVISYTESYRNLAIPTTDWIPEEAPEFAQLKYSTLRTLGATHIVTEGSPRLLFDDCVSLEQLDRLDKNPGLGTPLTRPFTLYEIKYCR
ncbi:MAG: hypothetical protein ACREQ7_08470 [Candidatus Binatia bacterium]